MAKFLFFQAILFSDYYPCHRQKVIKIFTWKLPLTLRTWNHTVKSFIKGKKNFCSNQNFFDRFLTSYIIIINILKFKKLFTWDLDVPNNLNVKRYTCRKLKNFSHKINKDPKYHCEEGVRRYLKDFSSRSNESNVVFWTFLRAKTCCVVCHAYCFCYGGTNGTKKCLKNHIPFNFWGDSTLANQGAGKTIEKPLKELPTWNQQLC